jgi:hypothetical protein
VVIDAEIPVLPQRALISGREPAIKYLSVSALKDLTGGVA